MAGPDAWRFDPGGHLTFADVDGFHPSSFWAKVRQHRGTYFYCLGAMPTLLLRMPADPADRDHRPVGYKKMQVTDADGRPVPAGAGMMDTYLPIPEKFSRWPG